MTILLAVYLGIAFYYFQYLWKAFRRDTNLSDQEKKISWLVLAVATIFWPIVLPFSYKTMNRRRQKFLLVRKINF